MRVDTPGASFVNHIIIIQFAKKVVLQMGGMRVEPWFKVLVQKLEIVAVIICYGNQTTIMFGLDEL